MVLLNKLFKLMHCTIQFIFFQNLEVQYHIQILIEIQCNFSIVQTVAILMHINSKVTQKQQFIDHKICASAILIQTSSDFKIWPAVSSYSLHLLKLVLITNMRYPDTCRYILSFSNLHTIKSGSTVDRWYNFFYINA